VLAREVVSNDVPSKLQNVQYRLLSAARKYVLDNAERRRLRTLSLSPTTGLATRERGNAFIRSPQIRSQTALWRLTPHTVRVTWLHKTVRLDRWP
jgi:hypothetical protein